MTVLTADFIGYIKKLFSNYIIVALSAVGAFLYKVCFPEKAYLMAACAVLAAMTLDILTKIYALARTNKNPFATGKINSKSFWKGTVDKILVFAILLVLCGAAYRLMPLSDIAVWFTQFVFTVMFLRDAISIIENLNDAGVKGLGIFKRAVKKKMQEFTEDYTENDEEV